MVQAKKQVTDGSKQAEGYKEEDENSVTCESVEKQCHFFFMCNKFLQDVWLTCASQFCICVNTGLVLCTCVTNVFL